MDKKLKRLVLSRDPLYPPRIAVDFFVPIAIVIVCLLSYPVLRYAGPGWVWGGWGLGQRVAENSATVIPAV